MIFLVRVVKKISGEVSFLTLEIGYGQCGDQFSCLRFWIWLRILRDMEVLRMGFNGI